MRRVYFQKILSLILTLSFVSGLNISPVKASDTVLISENFEASDSDIGRTFSGWNGWSGAYATPSDTVNVEDSDYTIEKETENSQNEVLQLYRETSTSASLNYEVSKSFAKVTSGIVSLKFKMMRCTNTSGQLLFRLYDGDTTNWDISVDTMNSRIIGCGPTVYFNGSSAQKVQMATNVWNEFTFFFDLTGDTGKASVYYENSCLGANIDFPTGFGKAITKLCIGTSRKEAGNNAKFFVDDVALTKLDTMKLISSVPSNGSVDVETDQNLELVFSQPIDENKLSNVNVEFDNGIEANASLDTQDNKKLIITIDSSTPLGFNTTYTATISGVTDIYGQVATEEIVRFKTRNSRLTFDEPTFYTDYSGTKSKLDNLSNVSGEVTAEIAVTKETDDTSKVLLIMEAFDGNVRKSLKVKEYGLSSSDGFNQTVTIAAGVLSGDTLKLTVLDEWESLKAYTPTYVFDTTGLIRDDAFTSGANSKSVHTEVDYEENKLKVKGVSHAGNSTVTLAVLTPGFSPNDITETNAEDAVCKIIQAVADENGNYSAEADVSEFNEEGYYSVIAGNEICVPFKVCTGAQVTTALTAVKNASAQELSKLLSGKEIIDEGLLLNDVLQLDLTEYKLLIEADAVLGELAGKTFADVDALRNTYYTAIEEQKSAEVRLKEVLETVNSATSDEMEDTLKSCSDVLSIDWDGGFAKLNSDDKSVLFENMSQYSFEKPKEIEDAFSNEVTLLLSTKEVLLPDDSEPFIYEGFEVPDASLGRDFLGWNGWSGGYKEPMDDIDVYDSFLKIIRDEENSSNKVLEIHRPTSTSKSIYHIVKKDLPSIQSKGVIRYSMRIKRMNDSTKAFRLTVIDHKEGTWDISFYMDSSRINCGETTVKLKENDGSNPAMPLNEWYVFDVFFNMDQRELSIWENGENLASGIKFPSSFSGGLQWVGIGSARNGAGDGAKFIVDDVKVDKVNLMKLAQSIPAKDDTAADISDELHLIFSQRVDEASLNVANISVENAQISEVKLDTQNNKKVIVKLNEKMDFNTSYTVNVSGIKDVYGQSAPDARFTFKTRKRRLLFENVGFFTDYEGDKTDITQSGLIPGEITAEINLVNEEGTGENILILLETERSGKTKNIEMLPYDVLTNNTQTQTVTVSTQTQVGDTLRLMVIDNWESLNCYSQIYTFDVDGLETENAADTEKIHAAVNYQTNKLEITGEAHSTAIAAVLKNGYTAAGITEQNVNDAVCELLQLQSDANGQYATQLDISGYEKNAAYSVIASDGKMVPFKIVTADLITAALDKVKISTKEELAAMLAGNPQLSAGVPINDVLQLDLSEYNTLSSKVDVTNDVAGKTFNNLNELRTAYYTALQRQIAYENRVAAIIKSVNDALWDGFENVLKNGSDLLQINWSGDYSKLNETYNSMLYKALAKDYTFTTLKQIEDTFSQKATELYLAQLNAGGTDEGGNDDLGGGGGGGGGVSGPVITEPIQMQKGEAFNDLDAVPWAQESINALSAKGIINGMGENKFAPNDTVTREQFVKMMVAAFNLKGKGTASFTDVDSSAWYAPYIGIALQNGIINGISAESFGVGSNITRSDMAVICTRIAKKCSITLPDAQEAVYTDAQSIPDYAKESAAVLQLAGIMTGDGSGRFAPKENATRAMAAKIIHMLMTFESKQ